MSQDNLSKFIIKKNQVSTWINILILGLLSLLYAPLLIYWLDGWVKKSISIEHEYFSHGIIGIPFAVYLAWTNRRKWYELPNKMNPIGAFMLTVGAVFYASNINEWVNLSLPIILAGLCLLLKGFPGFKLHGFPLVLILLATPNDIPYLITPFTLPLQSFIAGVAGFILSQAGMQVTVDGINIFVEGRIVEVAPYCAGLKMLFTTFYVGLILLYWMRILPDRRKSIWFLATSLLISVIANIIRNTILTYFHGSGQSGAFKWLHDGWGGDMYSALMLLTLIPVINWIDNYFSSPQILQQNNEA